MPAYNTPGVYIEEISGGPRPIQASSTTDTGFIGVLTLPKSFLAGKGKATNMFLPSNSENAQLAWNRAMAFRRLLTASEDGAAGKAKGKGKPAPKSSNRFENLVDELMDGKWSISSPKDDENNITLTSDKGSIVRFPARRTVFSVKTKEEGDKKLSEWDLSFAADDQSVMELIAGHAAPNNVPHSGDLPAADKGKSITLDVAGIQSRMQKSASMLTGMDSFEQWRRDFGQELFMEVLLEGRPDTSEGQAEAIWETLPAAARKSWDDWLRSHPGMRRLELGIRGFFENGGQTAFVTMALVEDGKDVSNKRAFLMDSFDGISAVAMLCCPGLDFSWQTSILEYAGPAGRGDLFAVLEAPRYYLTKAPRSVEKKMSPFRWVEADAPYEIKNLQTMATPQSTELRFSGYGADEMLDRAVPRDTSGYGAAYAPWLIVDNPISTGPHDRYVVAPPSGHVCGVIAATDLKPGGGVHKAPANEQVLGVADLVTEISDREQGVLNMKGINIIRHRPFAGIRIWGARTIASDPLWNYISVRRMFLMVERSVRDAIQWAVFLPNVPATRNDLKSTIAAFLYRLWKEGALDGATWSEAFEVQCDANNNPDVDVRAGLLTVDVQMRPVFPAEFIRVRFRQSPMRSEVTE